MHALLGREYGDKMWTARECVLQNEMGYSYSFIFPIKQILEKKDCVFVVLKKPVHVIMPDNAFCVDNSGSLRWQIEPDSRLPVVPGNLFLEIEDHGIRDRTFFYHAFSALVEVDDLTGEIVNTEQALL
jgi:hypothetical protein